MSGKVYAIGTNWGRPVKIGVAVDISRRLRALQTGNPDRLVVLWSTESQDAFSLEAFIHRELSEHRLEGERFLVLEDALAAAVAMYATTAADMTGAQSPEVIAAAAAVTLLVDIVSRKHDLSTELAMDHVARTTKIRRPVLWRLRYRRPEDVWVSDYQCIAHAVWSQAGLEVPASNMGTFVPSADELAAATLQLRSQTFGETPRAVAERTN